MLRLLSVVWEERRISILGLRHLPPGTKASVAYSNRSYNMRATATHSTGLMNNGWAFTGSAVWRWAKEGIIEGTFYNSWGYFLSAEKMINDRHSISLQLTELLQNVRNRLQ